MILLLALVVFDAYVSERIKVKHLEIRGLKVMKDIDVMRVVGRLKGKWIFVLFFGDIERKLKAKFGFVGVNIVPEWPDSVVIKVVEPPLKFVLVNKGKKWFVMGGFVVYPYREDIDNRGIMQVKVDYPMKLFPGKRIKDLFLRNVRTYKNAITREGFKVVRVEIVSAFKVVFYTARRVTFVCRGDGKELWKFRYLDRILKRSMKRKSLVVDMRFGNSVILK